MAHLTAQAKKQFEEWFDNTAGEDGLLRAMEIIQCYRDRGMEISFAQVAEMFDDMDTDEDMKLTKEEFMTGMEKAAAIKCYFQKLDTSGDHKLTKNELRSGLPKLEGLEIDMAHAEELINSADEDGDGYINYDEFVDALTAA